MPPLLALALTACGQAHDAPQTASDIPAAPAACAYVGASGICVAYDADAADTVTGEMYEENWIAIADCMREHYGTPVPTGPVVRIVAGPFVVNGQQVAGYHLNGQVTAHGGGTVRHEFIHYILWRAGFPDGINNTHQHPGWNVCAPGTL